jgi:methylated-DNA-[protein]-cysteine S-methyltransferase
MGVKMQEMSTIKAIKACDYTKFQKKVFLATFNIPKGETRTYKQIAVAIGHPNSQRAVGSALKANPFAPIVPCHRVVKSDGTTGNYSGKGGPKGKIRMLRKEGAI